MKTITIPLSYDRVAIIDRKRGRIYKKCNECGGTGLLHLGYGEDIEDTWCRACCSEGYVDFTEDQKQLYEYVRGRKFSPVELKRIIYIKKRKNFKIYHNCLLCGISNISKTERINGLCGNCFIRCYEKGWNDC